MRLLWLVASSALSGILLFFFLVGVWHMLREWLKPPMERRKGRLKVV